MSEQEWMRQYHAKGGLACVMCDGNRLNRQTLKSYCAFAKSRQHSLCAALTDESQG